MLRYRIFTQASDGSLHYGSRRDGIPATSQSLGAGPRELCMIVDAHGLVRGDLIFINNSWIHIDKVEPGGTKSWAPVDISWRYLPNYEDPDLVFGQEVWSPQLIARLTAEAQAMERRG